MKPLKMDLTEGSETSANINQTPGNHPKVDILKPDTCSRHAPTYNTYSLLGKVILILQPRVKAILSLEKGSIMPFERGDIQLQVPVIITPGTIRQQVRMPSDRATIRPHFSGHFLIFKV
jgi:hypothetical protein